MADLRLFIVADDPLARAGLSALLQDQEEWDIVGQSSDWESLGSEIDRLLPDIIVWDLGWEPEEQLANLSEILTDDSEGGPAIVALLPDQEQVGFLWSAGVRVLLSRDLSTDSLIAAIKAAANNLAVIDPFLLNAFAPAAIVEEPDLAEDLTGREIEVLILVAEGLSNKGIAQRLAISEHTVKFHLNAVMGKLGVQSRTAAVVRATRLGLIAL
jgi:DNA-binding NarL/FixJ family response regulator